MVLLLLPGDAPPPALPIPTNVWCSLPWYAKLAIRLCHEVALGPASSLAPYLAVLPDHVDVPCTWTDEELQQLQYPYLIHKVGCM